jgi:hypothetical protein
MAQLCVVLQLQITTGNSWSHRFPNLFKRLKILSFRPCAFNLPVRSGVRHSCPIHADVVIITKAKEFLASELGTIIGDETVWYSEEMDDVCEEEDYLF